MEKIEDFIYELLLNKNMYEFDSYREWLEYTKLEEKFCKSLNSEQLKSFNNYLDSQMIYCDKHDYEIICFVLQFVRLIFKS